MDWLLATGTLIIGMVGGYFIGRPDKAEREQARHNEEELRRIKGELADYRMGVTQHFSRSAELIDQMTSSYRSFYDHLVESSQRLCDDSDLQQLQQKVSESKQALPPKKTIEAETLDVEMVEDELFDAAGLEAANEPSDEIKEVDKSKDADQSRKADQLRKADKHQPEQTKPSTSHADIPVDHVTLKKPKTKEKSAPVSQSEEWSEIMPEKELAD